MPSTGCLLATIRDLTNTLSSVVSEPHLTVEDACYKQTNSISKVLLNARNVLIESEAPKPTVNERTVTADLVTALKALNTAVCGEVLNACDAKEIEHSYSCCSAASDGAEKLLARIREGTKTAVQESYEAKQKRLDAAFELIKPKGNWKNPIDCTMESPDAKTLSDIKEACVHFTGSTIRVISKRGNKHVRLMAAGYYATIGA